MPFALENEPGPPVEHILAWLMRSEDAPREEEAWSRLDGWARARLQPLRAWWRREMARRIRAESLARRLELYEDHTGVGLWDMAVVEQDPLNPSNTIFWSRSFRRLLGFTTQEEFPDCLGSWISRLHPEEAPSVLEAFRAHLLDRRGGTSYSVEYRLRCRDGSYRWFRDTGDTRRDADGKPLWSAGSLVDVHESVMNREARDRAESLQALKDALARREEQLHLAIEGSNDGIWDWRIDTGEVYFSPRWKAQIGFEDDELQASFETFRERVHPEDWPRVQEALEAYLARRQGAFSVEFRFRHKDGGWRWILARGVALWNAEGAPVRMAGSHTDVTERKEAEVRAEELRDRLDQLLSVSPSVVYAMDPASLAIRYLSPGVAELIGARPEEALGVPGWWPGRLLDEDRAEALGRVTRWVEGGGRGIHRLTYRMRHADGRVVWVMDQMRGIHDGQGRMVELVGGAVDISERVVLGERLEKIALNTPGVIYQFLRRPGGEIAMPYASPALREVSGLDPDSVREDARPLFERFHPEDAPRIWESMLQAAAHGTEWREQFRVCHPEKGVLWVEARSTPENLPDGSRLWHGVLLDISEQKRVEGELAEARHSAESAVLAKGRFLANMSHEIRTPMNAVLGLLHLLERTPLSERQREHCGKIKGAAQSLLGILNDILDFSKVEAGKLELERSPFRLDQVLRNLSAILSATVQGRELEVLFDIAPEVPRALVGDALRLQQVLINLCGNAVKFTPRGEVVLRIRLEAHEEERVWLGFAVEDTGIGIAPEKLASIFEGFSQAEASTTRRFGGTGLGLAISQYLVSLMGGRVEAESRPGKGSAFRFRACFGAAAQEEDPVSPPLRPGTLRVLVVDDNATARGVLLGMVRSLGWEAEGAGGGEEALARVGSGEARFDLVLMDHAMPDLDGLEAARQIRARLGAAAPLVIMVSAHGRELLAERGVPEGLLDGFLVKPITPSMLFDAVAGATGGEAARAEGHPAPGAAQRLAGIRILVVEDNAMNQLVAGELLASEGAHAVIAGTGAEALARARRELHAFDAILMDIQMPDMDGYAATAAIRHLPGGERVPIIAMTANALPSDREACLEAGMVDHVSKPVDLERLVATLLRHAGAEGACAPAVPLPACPAPAGEEALARVGGDRALLRRLIRVFLEGWPAWVEALRLCHTLKGQAGTLGASSLAASAREAELRLRARGEALLAPGEASELLAELEGQGRLAREALEALSRRLGEEAEGKAVPAWAGVGWEALEALHRLLEARNLGALDAMEALVKGADGDTAARLAPLGERVRHLDFEAAGALCRRLMEGTQP